MSNLARLLPTLLVTLALAPATATAAGPIGPVRVDQVGYTVEQPKVAWLLTPRARPSQVFHVVDRDGTVAFTGTAGPSNGRWSPTFHAVQPLDFSPLHAPVSSASWSRASRPSGRRGSGWDPRGSSSTRSSAMS